MLEMFETEFMQRAWLAGLIVAVICPLIGSFLVLRRQSMIGDGLGHIAFAGVAGGALMGWQPVLSAAAVTVLGALVIEWVRTRLAAFSEMILAIFFYSGIGLAVVFTSMNRMGGFNLSSILFGSLMTISSSDLWIVAGLGIFACIFVVLFYRPLQYLTFDETSARVAGLPADRLNMWLADGADSCAFDAYRRPAAGFRYDGDTGSLRTADGTQLCRDDLRRYCLWARYRFRWSDLILLC